MLEFDIIEYSVFIFMLGVSTLIGVYFGFIKKKEQDTVEGYLLGGKQMELFPIGMSLISSVISGYTLLGMPAEIYTFGSQYFVASLCNISVGIICIYIFLPVFYKLQLLSIYQYMEMRFNKKVRTMMSFFYTLTLLLYIPLVIYGPALALNQVSGLNVHGMALVVSAVCIFYTTVGGLKAVVWTDTLQTLIMVVSVVFVAIVGTIRVGGISAIMEAAAEGERLEMNNFDPDPFQRSTFWTVFIGLTITLTGFNTLNPSSTQRFISLNTMTKAKWSVLFYHTGAFIFFILSCYMGLVVYAEYKSCDPLATRMISSSDQIIPFFIMDVVGSYRGLPGLFVAGVVSAALSTMSAGLNTVSGTIYEDFIEPVLGKTTERRASNIMKILSAVFGILCVLLVMVIDKLGTLVELANTLVSLTTGSSLGIFILGLLFPHATSLGAIVGGLSGISAMSWIVIGSRSAIASGDLVYAVKPISVDGCLFNITGIDLKLPKAATSENVFPLYRLSIFYYTALGSITTVIVGLLVSFIAGPNRVEKVDRSLLTPVIHRFLPDYKPVPTKETELKQMKP